MHVPYGYRIIDGKAVVDEVHAEQVRSFFINYLSGKSLQTAAENAGLKITHSSAGKMMRNAHYLGDDYYPAIIDKELFCKADEERQTRATRLGRASRLGRGSQLDRATQLGRCREAKEKDADENEAKEKSTLPVPIHFVLRQQTEHYDNPFRQAEYIYSLIESEDNIDGND